MYKVHQCLIIDGGAKLQCSIHRSAYLTQRAATPAADTDKTMRPISQHERRSVLCFAISNFVVGQCKQDEILQCVRIREKRREVDRLSQTCCGSQGELAYQAR